MTERSARRDWVGNSRSYAIAWGVPTAALVAGTVVEPSARTFVWSTALMWMGLACVVNALRCGRIHCYLTGPFFLLMAVATVLHDASYREAAQRIGASFAEAGGAEEAARRLMDLAGATGV